MTIRAGKMDLVAAMAVLWVTALCAVGQVIPSERVFTNAWRSAGVVGAIPSPDVIVNVRDVGAVGDGVANDHGAIAAAVSSLGAGGGVVFFPAGTYLLQSALTIPSGVVLRGQRSDAATLRFDTLSHCISIGKNESNAFQPIVSGYTVHSRTLVVTDGSVFAAGDYAETQQENDPAWGAGIWTRVTGQILKIVAVAGNTLTLENPMRLTYGSDRSPEIRKIIPVTGSGVENLKVERLFAGTEVQRNNIFTLEFRYAANCWARGVEFYNGFGGHIGVTYSTKIDVTGCYIHHAHEYDGGGSGYGVRMEFRTGESLIENNVFQRLRHAMLVQAGVNGNVFGYNYSREPNRTEPINDLSSDITLHGNYPFANLYEGNICQHIWIDASHYANGPLNTFFRNRAEDHGFNMTDSLADNQNVVGNETFKGSLFDILGAGDGYSLKGSGHFEYGNLTEADGLQPADTGDLTDTTYYLSSIPPAFWTIAETLPVIGPPHALDALGTVKRNPAYARFAAGGVLTVAPPSIARQPTNRIVATGEEVSFSVEAYGTPLARYTWLHDGVPIADATNAILVLDAAAAGDAGSYAAVVYDDHGTVTSAVAVLTVTADAPTAQGFAIQWR